MDRSIKQFDFILRTMAPVHIGSGNTASTKEFIYENNSYYFPEMVKMFQKISEQGEKSVRNYESFLLNNSGGLRLIKFLNDNNIKSRDFGGYRIKASGFEEARGGQTGESLPSNLGKLKSIDLCIKDPYGLPYIPGSSLKGAIRTILVNQYFKKDNNRYHRNTIEWGAKRDKEFFDIFNNIRVGDSESISEDNLILAQKTDYSLKKNADRPLPLTRECIKPFTLIKFRITTVGPEAAELIENLGIMARAHYSNYSEYFLSEFPKELKQDNFGNPIYIGAGSGLWTKTLLSEAESIRKAVQKTAPLKMKMKGKGTLKVTRAPQKGFQSKGKKYLLIKNSNNLYEMGKCIFSIREREG